MTEIVGILNLTPDSFSDGGVHSSLDAAANAIETMISHDVSVIDIGAESTRPSAGTVSAEEEWARLSPLLMDILPAFRGDPVTFSLDTRHPENAVRALPLGIHWINDVTGFSNPAMIDAVREEGCRLVVMHSLTVPPDPKVTLPAHSDPVEQVMGALRIRLEELEAEGIERERIIIDPGIGFGKTSPQSFQLVRRAREFKKLGVPVLVGHSRKSFLRKFTESEAQGRDGVTTLLSAYLIEQGIDYVRVHNTAQHADMLRVLKALG